MIGKKIILWVPNSMQQLCLTHPYIKTFKSQIMNYGKRLNSHPDLCKDRPLCIFSLEISQLPFSNVLFNFRPFERPSKWKFLFVCKNQNIRDGVTGCSVVSYGNYIPHNSTNKRYFVEHHVQLYIRRDCMAIKWSQC